MTLAAAQAPPFDWAALSPIIALAAGMVFSLLGGLFPRSAGALLSLVIGSAGAIAATGLALARWNEPAATEVIGAALVIDRAALAAIAICSLSALTGILLAARARGTTAAGHGETTAMIMAATTGMAILAGAGDLITLFLGLELLSIPLYVLCASHVDRSASLESGLKYLILGSAGSAFVLMGIALVYGATGEMQLAKIAPLIGESELAALTLPGIAMIIAGLGFKVSLAPLHQWTPDVYDGAPTAVTAFMSVATKTAALVILARVLVTGLDSQYEFWHPMLMTLAAISIVVGNVGAIGQSGMKRMLGYSSVAQAGYLVAALSVGAIASMIAYLAAYAVCTLAVFAVVAARESRVPHLGDDVASLDGLARERPLLAWVGTLGLFGLAGLPISIGFFGKIAVIGSLVAAGETGLGVLVIVGSIISLAYYVPPVLRIWRRAPGLTAEPAVTPHGDPAPFVDPGETEAPAQPGPAFRYAATGHRWEVVAVAVVFGVLVLAGGIYPQPVFDLAGETAGSLLGAP